MGHSLTAASSTSWVGFGEKHEGRKKKQVGHIYLVVEESIWEKA
jgi:hypothetical protein